MRKKMSTKIFLYKTWNFDLTFQKVVLAQENSCSAEWKSMQMLFLWPRPQQVTPDHVWQNFGGTWTKILKVITHLEEAGLKLSIQMCQHCRPVLPISRPALLPSGYLLALGQFTIGRAQASAEVAQLPPSKAHTLAAPALAATKQGPGSSCSSPVTTKPGTGFSHSSPATIRQIKCQQHL